MAPKKSKEEPKERPVLGRFKSNLKASVLPGVSGCHPKADMQRFPN